MDNRAIGVFDSGLGGLTAARVLEEILPAENIIYFGDTANMPYGVRSKDDIVRLARQNAEFLLRYDVKAILVACGTVTSNAMDVLRSNYAVPFFGVVGPAVVSAAENTENGRVGVIATEATIRSGAYRRALQELGKGLKVFDSGCSSFVPLVESGHYSPKDSLVRAAVEKELRGIKNDGVDTLILGCTHFPLLEEAISEYMGSDVRLISSGGEAALALADHLHRSGGLRSSREAGTRQWFTSGDVDDFAQRASVFLGHSIEAGKATF